MKKLLDNNHQVIFWVALALLFVLRLPLSWIGDAIYSTRVWADPVYEIGTYGLIIFLIWWERDNLEIHHMDAFAIFIIILFKPISTIILRVWKPDSPMAFPHPLSLLFFIAALILLVLILRKQLTLKVEFGKTLLWMLAGGLVAILFYVVLAVFMVQFFNYPILNESNLSMMLSPFYQIGYAAVVEEPFFRGFLWGGLKKVGVKDIWILFIQAGLFAVGHLNLLKTINPVVNISFVFLGALLMGILVWRSKKLSTSLIFHGFGNGSAIFQYWAESLIFR